MGLAIVGCGIDPARHLTLEAAGALRSADAVFTLMPKSWTNRLPVDIAAVCESMFDQCYITGRPRTAVYEEVAECVARHAATRDVALAVQGGPTWFDSVVGLLGSMCRAAGIEYRLIAGVSAAEAVLTRIGQLVAPSVLITDAASLIEGNEILDARRPTLIMQPHVATSATVLSDLATSTGTLAALGRVLGLTFPAAHEVLAVALAGEWSHDRHFAFSVRELAAGAAPDLRGATLFLPPAPGSPDS